MELVVVVLGDDELKRAGHSILIPRTIPME